MKKFAALFMTVVMLLALIGCGNDMDKFVGVWSGESVGGTELDVDSEFLSGFAEALAGMVASSMRLELKADGTGSIFAFGKDEQFTWTASGDNLTIKLPSSEMKPEYKDGKIIIKSEDSDSSIFLFLNFPRAVLQTSCSMQDSPRKK